MIGTAFTVYVVDDDASVRKALERLLRAAGMNVSSCASAEEYLERFDSAQPGCIVLDLSMPGLNGLELQAALALKGASPPIIFLSGRADIPSTVQAMKRGAIEFLTKPVDEAALIEAIHNAVKTDRASRVALAELAEIRERLATLTARESEVLQFVVAGMLNKQTAYELGTAEKTIKVHRARIMEKMKVRSLAQLVRLAARVGIGSPPNA